MHKQTGLYKNLAQDLPHSPQVLLHRPLLLPPPFPPSFGSCRFQRVMLCCGAIDGKTTSFLGSVQP